MVAKEKQWFEDALKSDGVQIEHIPPFNDLPLANDAIAARSVDFVFEAEIPATVGYASGKDVQVVGMLSAVKAEEIVVPSSSQVRSIGDLKGKKVAVMPGSGYHYALLQALKREGLTGTVEVVPMTPPDAKAAFRNNAVDAWAIWPHWPEQEVFDRTGKLISGLNARVQVVTVARGAFVDEHPRVVEKVLEVLERAKRWVEENPAEAQRITSKAVNIQPEVVAMSWPKEVWITSLTPEVIDDIQKKADYLLSEKKIDRPVDVKQKLVRRVSASVAILIPFHKPVPARPWTGIGSSADVLGGTAQQTGPRTLSHT